MQVAKEHECSYCSSTFFSLTHMRADLSKLSINFFARVEFYEKILWINPITLCQSLLPSMKNLLVNDALWKLKVKFFRSNIATSVDIDVNIDNLKPMKTKNQNINMETISINFRKKNISFYKESVVEIMWNVTTKLVLEKYCENFGVTIDSLNVVRFEFSEGAGDAALKIIQMKPEKRRKSSSAFTYKEWLQVL